MAQQHQPGIGRRRATAGGDHRPIPVITAELAEVERHLREVPPHHGGGAADLSGRADALRRELAAATTAHERAAATTAPAEGPTQRRAGGDRGGDPSTSTEQGAEPPRPTIGRSPTRGRSQRSPPRPRRESTTGPGPQAQQSVRDQQAQQAQQ